MLRCFRHYIEHDMYMALEAHTGETLRSGRIAMLKYSDAIAVSLNSFLISVNMNRLFNLNIAILRTVSIQELEFPKVSC